MKDNLIQFPEKHSNHSAVVRTAEDVDMPETHQLIKLRQAFDEARKHWPLEMAELPEQNRKCAHSSKR
ncbi:hypothetical protein [Marinomonas ostreistagni]|uniref:hypothetical protein n=1 Tax=Marinomonas ostreistagni TaxID=359209 RepID=UPI0019508A75|nr:hypothetical protein [Marinomonas ostreistagni]MBM6551608.1 hypothetical protein [Marinomonas ostreistagni]